MSLERKLDIEPLTDARLAKIRNAVFEELDRQEQESRAPSMPQDNKRLWGRAFRFSLLGVVLTGMAVLTLVLMSSTWHARPLGVASNPSRIVTGTSESHLALGDSSIDIGPDSIVLSSGDDDRGVLVVLERGSVTFDIAPRRGRPPFVVQAGDVRVRVIGTHFTVTRIDDGARVDVEHGTVEVTESGQTSLVRDGQTWEPRAPLPPAQAISTPQGIVPALRAERVEAPKSSAESGLSTQRALSGWVSPSGRPARASSSNPAPMQAVTTAETAAPQPDADVTTDLSAEQFDQAAAIERQDPSRAITIYGHLAVGSGPWAMNALFAQGRLESDRGNVWEARRLLSSYLARYPRGNNAADARLLLGRLK